MRLDTNPMQVGGTWRYVLSGASPVATLHAAYSFAEDVLGVRFYPHGDVVPTQTEQDVVTIPDIGLRECVVTPFVAMCTNSRNGGFVDLLSVDSSRVWRSFARAPRLCTLPPPSILVPH